MEMKSVSSTESRFEAVVREYSRFLRQTIRRVCPKDLGLQFDEIEQEARLRLWRALESEREIRDLSSYLYRVAVTATLDAVRKVRRKREEQLLSEGDEAGESSIPPHHLMTDPGQAPDREAERQQIVSKIREAMAGLPENRRTAVGLYLEGLTTPEIAELLGWSEPKARNLVYRGLSDIRQFLKEAGIEYEPQ
ncbi:MAG: RNA polymerase sigma factor [Blastocatellia bacterium]